MKMAWRVPGKTLAATIIRNGKRRTVRLRTQRPIAPYSGSGAADDAGTAVRAPFITMARKV